MTAKVQTPETDNETNAIQDMINEGGLGAEFYYLYESPDE
ncbi:hypothetical protein GCM10028868_00740 [Virgibacillus kimchii]